MLSTESNSKYTGSIPLCDPNALFFNTSVDERTVFCNDRRKEWVIDELAVLSILQFGAIVPPLSPWKNVKRFVPGYKYSNGVATEKVSFPSDAYRTQPTERHQVEYVTSLLDQVLKSALGEETDPVLLFSGGVDSGLIAARLSALGYHDTLLLNFSFGDNDQESILAESMANALKLKFKRMRSPASGSPGCLMEPGKHYPLPFSDISVAPSFDLANSVVSYLDQISVAGRSRIILDGTGADGGFGMTARIKSWQQISRIPNFLRSLASKTYPWIWRTDWPLEKHLRILRRSITLNPVSAIIAQNPLQNILYKSDDGKNISNAIENWIVPWAGESFIRQVVAADLAVTCANIFAQKSLSILKTAGHQVVFPFLSEEFVSLAMEATENWRMVSPKEPLKQSLARSLGREYVYRTKSSFVDPKRSIFNNSCFIDFLRESIQDSSTIKQVLNKKNMLKACDSLVSNRKLPYQTLSCLWGIVFTDRWYRTVPTQQ